MSIHDLDATICLFLRDLHLKFDNRYTSDARQELLKVLFSALVGYDRTWLAELFGGAIPPRVSDWDLSKAQGNFEGSEYSEHARGKRCGHIFKTNEATYRCKTCATDDTCVLCSKCFAATDHTGHQFLISVSPGNSGCCDCGDDEAWNRPLCCAIHTAHSKKDKAKAKEDILPEDLESAVRITIARAFDFVCDIVSCSPEQMRLPKTEDAIRLDQNNSRLNSRWYSDEEPVYDVEFCLLLWNDEKHSVAEVTSQVARACKKPTAFGRKKAQETDDFGRSILMYDTDLKKLLHAASIIEKIKITTTIRTARDTFRENMCGTIIDWLSDICGCRIGPDGDILKTTICEEMLKPWRQGSCGSNVRIGRDGIYDHEIDETLQERAYLTNRTIHDIQIQPNGVVAVTLLDPLPAGQTQATIQTGPVQIAVTTADGDDGMWADPMNSEDVMDIDAILDDADEFARVGDDDPVEQNEAALAGYPPPPPPPPPAPRATPLAAVGNHARSIRGDLPTIPRTPKHSRALRPGSRPSYWVDRFDQLSRTDLSIAEDVRQRVRLDWLMLWDLRMWKKARIDLRNIFIRTLVTVPEFKRILGLRFSGLYPLLAQVYLIADREPDHSIIYLSLQVITTPSVTKEVVEKGNFMTNLFAVLYTFLTTRQVGHPHEVNPAATLAFETGSVTNRRMYHFFMDIKHLFAADYIQEMLRTDDRYVLQFLDLIRLGQGICPNIRAIGDHVEYETDTWISASLFTREVNRLCRLFSDAFKWDNGNNHEAICRVMRIFARAAILNAMGYDRKPLDTSEVQSETKFKMITQYRYSIEDTETSTGVEKYTVVDFNVESGPISFHHALQYMVSWMVECGKSMSATEVRRLLSFSSNTLKGLGHSPEYSSESLLLAMFDYPLRVCVWLAQMKAQLWVRNGMSLRHQMNTYRTVAQRDLAYQRDMFNLQTAMVVCNPGRVLLQMVDRFGMINWMAGDFKITEGWEESQMVDVFEEFIHLLLVILTERSNLMTVDEVDNPYLTIRRDLIHALCFKPSSFSELCNRVADKYQDLEEFQDLLESMTTYKAPEGMNDSGVFTLKPEYLAELDPYINHYSKNQRDEAEAIYRKWVAKETGKPLEDVVVEPKVHPIKMGLFQDLGAFTRTHIFIQILTFSCHWALVAESRFQNTASARIETVLNIILHLMLAALADDTTTEGDSQPSFASSFLQWHDSNPGALTCLNEVLGMSKLQACHSKIRVVFTRLLKKRPQEAAKYFARYDLATERFATTDTPSSTTGPPDSKKENAIKARNRAMAQFQQQQQAFMNQQDSFDWGDLEDESEQDNAMETEEPKKIWKYPGGNCILCQEETNEHSLYGCFGLLSESRVLRLTNMNDPDHLEEVMHVPDNLDRSADHIRPFGIAGKNHTVIKKHNDDGTETDIHRQVLSRGWDPEFVKSGIMSTGCGHVMHWKCFNTYCAATEGRHSHQIARNHPEKISRKEFVCPLCKALGNAFYPIIWKGKEESYPSILNVTSSLNDFLSKDYEEKLRAALLLNHSLAVNLGKLSDRALAGSLLTDLDPVSPIQAYLQGMPGEFPNEENARSLTDDLVASYDRLRSTFIANKLPSSFVDWLDPPKDHNTPYTDVLPLTLASSISSLEIAQRGADCNPTGLLFDKISENTLTHLRILSETASTYVALGFLRPSSLRNMALRQEMRTSRDRQLGQLFWAVPATQQHLEKRDIGLPALLEDPFILLAEASCCIAPVLDLDIHHIMQLCYIMEMVKVVLAVLYNGAEGQYFTQEQHLNQIAQQATEQDIDAFRNFVCFIELGTDRSFQSHLTDEAWLRRLYAFVTSYSLAFIRKSAILLHVRYGVDFSRVSVMNENEPELSRLSRALQLPQISELFGLFNLGMRYSSESQHSPVQNVVADWISHWREGIRQDDPETQMNLCHPGIFELIGLPEYYETLLEAMMLKRCPNSKRELVTPSLCLFCGEILCGQGVCCTVDGKGGCNQHLEKCGGHTGIFLELRKCSIVYLHRGNGSFTHAPYLDKHGEVDFGLRRGRQLILNRKRYDTLIRKNWLEHGIPTTISRKLEADINNGGWETL